MVNARESFASIIKIGIVPVVRASSAEHAIQAIEAIRAGGILAAEITMTVPGAIRALEKLADRFGDAMLLGAGTVLDAETELARKHCHRFVEGPRHGQTLQDGFERRLRRRYVSHRRNDKGYHLAIS